MRMSSCSGLAGRNEAPEGGGAPQDLCALQNVAEPPGVPNDALFPHAAARQRGAVLTPGKRTPPRRAMRSPSSLERGRGREVPGLREVSGLTAQATAPVGFSAGCWQRGGSPVHAAAQRGSCLRLRPRSTSPTAACLAPAESLAARRSAGLACSTGRARPQQTSGDAGLIRANRGFLTSISVARRCAPHRRRPFAAPAGTQCGGSARRGARLAAYRSLRVSRGNVPKYSRG
jgi:hypothetical protein